MAKEKLYATEAEMCAQFIAELPEEWTAYAETAGWDILLVRRDDGFQIGIEAKLRLNGLVLSQALEDWHMFGTVERPGPDCRAVLIPEGTTGNLDVVAAYVGLTVITIHPRRDYQHGASYRPALPKEGEDRYYSASWREQCPVQRHELPGYIPDVAAGASAPLKLTSWKIAAIKIAVTIEKRGYITRQDFKHHEIDHRRWLPHEGGWLAYRGDGGFIAGPHMPDFRTQHPTVYEQIAAEYEQWKLPEDPPLQGALL